MKLVFKMNQISYRYRFIEVDSLPKQQYENKKCPVIALPYYDKAKAYWYAEEYRRLYKKL